MSSDMGSDVSSDVSSAAVRRHACRLCGQHTTEQFLDLGVQPLANSILRPDADVSAEPTYPLLVRVCRSCWLVQLEDFARREQIFGDEYSYFSSFSTSWLQHARDYVSMISSRLGLDADSFVVEVASNDGYLLRNFVQRKVPVLGVEPSANTAEAARGVGVPTEIAFFGRDSAQRILAEHRPADLIICNNVLAHVPDLNDFVSGLGALLHPQGVVTIEAPHLLRLIEQSQFDTIYHEHYSYFSLSVLRRVFARQGLEVVDVEELSTHGGSLRTYVRHAGVATPTAAVDRVCREELAAGLEDMSTYDQFERKVVSIKEQLLAFFVREAAAGRTVAGYGAPAKGNTLLNYCGVGAGQLLFTVDASPHKQGHLLPGSHVPIKSPADLIDARPDSVLILPWNLRGEIVGQMQAVREWGGSFFVAIPELSVVAS